MRLAPLAPIVGFALALSTPAAAQSGSSGRGDVHQGHRADPSAQLPALPHPERRRADAADDLRGRAAVGARHQDADRPGSARGRDAAVVRREEHRHPALQERSRRSATTEIAKIAKWADSGAPRGNPADMPPPREFANADKWTIGEPDLVLRSPDVIVPAVGPDKWGSLGARADRPHRGSLRLGRRSPRGQRHPEERSDQYGGRTLRLPPHDVLERGARRGGRRHPEPTMPQAAARAGRFMKSAATPTSSRPKPAACSRRTRRSR